MLNQISYEEGSRENARITHALLQLVGKINDKFPTKDDAKKIIKALGAAFIVVDGDNPALKLREKNEIVRLIYPFFIDHPVLVQEFIDTDLQAIICAIAHKMKIAPNIEELRLLQKLSQNASSNFAKGHIVNALAELIYSGQIRIGEEAKIFEPLNILKAGAKIPLQKNIERVEVELKYFLGQIK